MNKIVSTLKELQLRCHSIAKAHGWWDKEVPVGTAIALMHSELSEALEAERNRIEKSEHIPEFTGLEEELADCVIRILDYSGSRILLLAEAIEGKIIFNENRSYRHGNKSF